LADKARPLLFDDGEEIGAVGGETEEAVVEDKVHEVMVLIKGEAVLAELEKEAFSEFGVREGSVRGG